MKTYPVQLEIAGPAAIFTRPDSGASFLSYPVPTYSALKGIFECVARWNSAYIKPTHVGICSPVQFQSYATNYGGPLRKSNQLAQGSSYQLFATILVDVCYKVYGLVTEATNSPENHNHLHALQEVFERRLKRGQLYRTPCLGWSEFVPSYFGPLRTTTNVCENIDLVIPSMLRRVFNRDCAGQYEPAFEQNAHIEKGVLLFA
jgi:CRISPR-associated protein Cas5d